MWLLCFFFNSHYSVLTNEKIKRKLMEIQIAPIFILKLIARILCKASTRFEEDFNFNLLEKVDFKMILQTSSNRKILQTDIKNMTSKWKPTRFVIQKPKYTFLYHVFEIFTSEN